MWMDWITYPGSFMLKLKQHGINDAKIQILNEGWLLPVNDERIILDIRPRRLAWVREVIIRSGETIWMYARTVIPAKTLTGKERILQHLKTRSLGSILFSYPEIIRNPFEYFSVEMGSVWHTKLKKKIDMPRETLPGRRSVFSLREKSLLLTEIFFPSIMTL